MKKLVSILLAAMLLLSVPMGAAAATLPFKDVPANAWYAKSVEYVYTHGLFSGTAADKFDPDQPMTRAMFVQVMANKTSNYQKTDWANKNSFSDVKRGKWYAAPIAWAAKAGLANGIGGGKFGWNQNVTREQAILFLYNYSKKTGNDTQENDIGQYFMQASINAGDGSKVSSWAKTAMTWALGHGIIHVANDYTLEPRRAATRAEVADFFAKADFLLKNTVVDVEPGPDDPAPEEPYRSVIQAVIDAQSSQPSYSRVAKGFFYDLDGDSVDELIMLYSVRSRYADYKAASVYTIKNGKAVALIQEQKLYDEVSAPKGEVAVMTKGGKTYLGLYDQNGGETTEFGKWVTYTLQGGTLRKANTAEFQRGRYNSSRNSGTIDGKTVSYAQYQSWVNGFAKKKSVTSPSGTDIGGSTLQQLIKQI